MDNRTSRTLAIVQRFNQAFIQHDPALLDDLVGEGCVMESVEPAPEGTRYTGRAACLDFWRKLADSREGEFTAEDMSAGNDLGIIRWRYRFGPGLAQSVRGVTVMRVQDDRIVQADGYVKSGGTPLANG